MRSAAGMSVRQGCMSTGRPPMAPGRLPCQSDPDRALGGHSRPCCPASRAASGMSYKQPYCTPREKPEEQLVLTMPSASLVPLEACSTPSPACEQQGIAKATAGRTPCSLHWADPPGSNGLPEAIQHLCTCRISKRFVLAHIVHQARSQHMVISHEYASGRTGQ